MPNLATLLHFSKMVGGGVLESIRKREQRRIIFYPIKPAALIGQRFKYPKIRKIGMDEEQIDAQFEDEKNRIEKEYRDGLAKGLDSKKLRAEFDVKLKKAIETYTKRSLKIIKPGLTRKTE